MNNLNKGGSRTVDLGPSNARRVGCFPDVYSAKSCAVSEHATGW